MNCSTKIGRDKMKVIYGDKIEDMFYQYMKYTPNATEPVSKLVYRNKLEEFIRRLNELEVEFGFSITADYSTDHDDWTTASLQLWDNKYGCVGEIHEMHEEEETDNADE